VGPPFRRNSRVLPPLASVLVGEPLLPCGAARLRVATAHQFASG
jgi:hypothetical protein